MKSIICVLISLLIFVSFCESLRMKRKVVFIKNSKFFLRLNGKEPILPFTTIFQHGWGFKISWDLPESVPKLHNIYRRDVNTVMQDFLNEPNSDNYFCILKHFANKISRIEFGEYCGVLCKISDILQRTNGDDVKFFKSVFSMVQNFNGNCPDTHYELSPFTDV